MVPIRRPESSASLVITPMFRNSTTSLLAVSSAETVVWVPSEGAYSNVVACGLMAEQPVVPRTAANAKPANTFRRVVLTFTMVLLVKIRCARGDVIPCSGRPSTVDARSFKHEVIVFAQKRVTLRQDISHQKEACCMVFRLDCDRLP